MGQLFLAMHFTQTSNPPTHMRSIILLLFIFLPLTVKAQEKLEGGWGLKFGTSQDSAIHQVKLRLDVSPYKQTKDMIVYKESKFGSDIAYTIRLLFNEGKLYFILASIIPSSSPQILDDYNRIKQAITEKYFEPTASAESYRYPFERGDGHEITAIRGGYANIGCYWNFPKTESVDPQGNIFTQFLK